jgi:hypothetical protein
MIKKVSVTVSVNYSDNPHSVRQTFKILGPKKNRRYLFDNRFLLSTNFEKKIKEHALSSKDKRFTFINRYDILEEGLVILEFVTFVNDLPNSFYFTLEDFVPIVFGCEFCKNLDLQKEKLDNKIFCNYFKKYVVERKKSCKYFKQLFLFKT